MKRLSFLLFIFGFYFISNAQLQYESFDAATLPTGWTTTTTATGCAWKFGFTGSLPGSGFFTQASFPSGGVVFDDGECGSSYDNHITLIGPEIDLISLGITSAAIEIIYNHQTYNDDGNFFVDVWDGVAWTNILTVDGDMPEPDTGLNETTIVDVSAFINSQFRVKFTWDDESSDTSWGLGIDDYKLTNTATVGIDDLSSLDFNYYPNPISNNELTINTKEDISTINIYNTIGELLIIKRPEAQHSKIYFENFPTGIYIVKVAIRDKKQVFKVVKK